MHEAAEGRGESSLLFWQVNWWGRGLHAYHIGEVCCMKQHACEPEAAEDRGNVFVLVWQVERMCRVLWSSGGGGLRE
jgi:hypothetical protein